jgi:hypothetical protein
MNNEYSSFKKNIFGSLANKSHAAHLHVTGSFSCNFSWFFSHNISFITALYDQRKLPHKKVSAFVFVNTLYRYFLSWLAFWYGPEKFSPFQIRDDGYPVKQVPKYKDLLL